MFGIGGIYLDMSATTNSILIGNCLTCGRAGSNDVLIGGNGLSHYLSTGNNNTTLGAGINGLYSSVTSLTNSLLAGANSAAVFNNLTNVNAIGYSAYVKHSNETVIGDSLVTITLINGNTQLQTYGSGTAGTDSVLLRHGGYIVSVPASSFGGSGVTSLTPGVGFLSHTPITGIGTMNVDTLATIAAKSWAFAAFNTKSQDVSSYQPLENQRLSTTNSPSFVSQNITGTGGNGFLDIVQQSLSPTPVSGHLRIYPDSLNRFSWKNSMYRRTIRVGYPSDMTINMPYKLNPILADSGNVKAITDANYAAIGLKQAKLISANPSAPSSTIATSDSVNMAVWKLQAEINTSNTNISGKAVLGDDNNFKLLQAAGFVLKGYPPYMILGSNSTAALTTGSCYFIPIWVPVTTTLTGVKVNIVTNGAYTASNFNGVGLMTLSGGTLINVAASSNTGTAWSSGTGVSTIPFTSTYSAAAGLYYIELVYSESAQTTQPLLQSGGSTQITFPTVFFGSNHFWGFTSGNTSLPTSLALSSLTSLSNLSYAGVY